MAQIYLRYGYRGRKSNEQFIPAGVYDDHDPLVMSIVAYLVDTGHAVVVEPEPEQDIIADEWNVEPYEKIDPDDEVSFTNPAVALMNQYGLDRDVVATFFHDQEIYNVSKSDMQTYIENMDSDS